MCHSFAIFQIIPSTKQILQTLESNNQFVKKISKPKNKSLHNNENNKSINWSNKSNLSRLGFKKKTWGSVCFLFLWTLGRNINFMAYTSLKLWNLNVQSQF